MYDMTIQLQTGNGKCLYEQIYEHIKQEIKEGKLLAGERLPSTRSLAEYLQVARSTVEYAYDQLLSEGYIESEACRGYFVCPVEDLFQLTGESSPVDLPDGNLWTSETMDNGVQYDFSPYKIDMGGFPLGVWKRITRKMLSESNCDLFAQGDPRGDYNLRLTISRYLHSSRGVECTPEQIIVGAGHDYLLMLLEKILGQGRKVVMENATYKRAYHIFKSFAYDIRTIGTDKNGMKVSELGSTDADVVYTMPAHQFPTGVVMPIGRRTELLHWADAGENRYIIEDDYDSEFRYRGKPIPALQSLDKRGKVIFMGTFSKAIAPAIRVGYMVLPKELLARYQKEYYFYSCTVSRIDQSILNEFISSGSFERHLNKMRKYYRAKHDLLLECLKPFEKKFRILGEDAGLHLLLTARDQISEEELLESAEKSGVKVYPFSGNLVTEENGKATILLGFGGLSEAQIKEGMALLEKAWL